MRLNPQHLTVAELLEGRLFRIPDYQRAYSWDTKQRKDLFDDIKEAQRTGREHFMATVVALFKEEETIQGKKFKAVELVDGQQRLTTIIILLKAIEKRLDQNDPSHEKLKENLQKLLIKGDQYSPILLQTNHDSSNIFKDYLHSKEQKINIAKIESEKNLLNATKECDEFVDIAKNNKSIIDLLETLMDKFSMIYHELNDESIVYRVFEVLNSRGLEVKWIDKLKSQLMASLFECTDQGTRERALHELKVIWKDIYATLELDIELGNTALCFAGTFKSKNPENRIISQERAVSELIQFSEQEINKTIEVGRYLLSLIKTIKKIENNRRIVVTTSIGHAKFVAVAISLREFDDATKKTIMSLWENTTFRIFGLGRADSRHKIGDYVRLGCEIIKNNLKPEDIILQLKEIGKDYSIDKISLNNEDNYYNDRPERLRYILYRYDEYLATEGGERMNEDQWNKVWADTPSRSIEHITPQSSEESYIHYLGNLTMLPGGVNSSLQNKEPKEKAKTYIECGLKATAAVGSEIQNGKVWDEKAVKERTELIKEFIKTEWADKD